MFKTLYWENPHTVLSTLLLGANIGYLLWACAKKCTFKDGAGAFFCSFCFMAYFGTLQISGMGIPILLSTPLTAVQKWGCFQRTASNPLCFGSSVSRSG